ncbi:MAG: YihY/virulence factor BrkB family protein [Bacteroidales bacterium]|nr:YihY/virulence factor BrkB family protein [Bacteroidales bacterium]
MRDLFEEIRDLYRWLVKFITNDLWHLDLDDFSKAKKRALRYLKVAIITIKKSGNDRLGLYAVSLSFFAAMSVVPFAAVALAVTGGIGFSQTLRELLYENFAGNQEVLNWILQFADNIIQSGQKDIFGVISALFFVWIVIWMILNIEKCFNEIWNVERGRSIAKRFLYYFGILVTAPFMILIFLSVYSVFTNQMKSILGMWHFEELGILMQWLLFFGIILLMFTAMYKYIPNVKVRFSAAFNAAVISATAFVIMQYLYMETQILVSRINAVYGAFAAVPLFLIWMNISWVIILIGAEISHAYQYAETPPSEMPKQIKQLYPDK